MRVRFRGTITNKALALPVVGLLALVGPWEAAAAPQPLSTNEKYEFNYAFATRLGSGIYTISGRTLQVYRLPFSVTFRSDEEGTRRGWRFTFPVTLGFYNFKAGDIIENGLPQDLATVSLIPGAEFFIPATSNWLLKPYAEAGRVWDRSGDADAMVYAGGVRSRADFTSGRFDLSLGNDLGYTVVDPASKSESEALTTLETAFEARHALGGGGAAKVDYGLYLVQRVYFQKPAFPLNPANDPGILDQYEVGVTIGSREGRRIWKIPLPRFGVAYLFGQDLSAFRIVFGSPAPSLRP